MSKRVHIPEKIFIDTNVNSYDILCGAYSNEKINAKYINLSSTAKTNKYVLVDNAQIDKVKLISSSLFSFSFNNDEWVTYIQASEIADAVISGSVEAGSIINGPFRFVKHNNQFKLVREGSSFYQDILIRNKRQKMPKVRSKNFKVGTIYCTPAGYNSVYLGTVNSYDTYYTDITKINLVTKSKLLYSFGKNIGTKDMFLKENDIWVRNFSLKKNHSFVDEVGEITVPDNIIPILRDKFKKEFKTKVSEHCNDSWYMTSHLRWDYMAYCPIINLHDSSEKDFKVFDISKYLTIA